MEPDRKEFFSAVTQACRSNWKNRDCRAKTLGHDRALRNDRLLPNQGIRPDKRIFPNAGKLRCSNSYCGTAGLANKLLEFSEMLDLNRTISALRQFFLREVPRLSQTYHWKIPLIDGFTRVDRAGYQTNFDIKAHFKRQWEAASDDGRLQIAKIIVSDWGGVRANRSETLKTYVNAILEAEPPTPLHGVASYSKIFAMVEPTRFAIYDARVAACLNAVQINAGVERGVAFNYVPGRNNVVGNVALRQGFTQDARFSPKRLVSSGWLPVKRSETYKKYLEVLTLCRAELPNFDLVSLEMALFANAERECLRAMKEQPGSTRPCTRRTKNLCAWDG